MTREPDAQLPDYLPISMLNQLTYCERRFWLMYVCGEMEINAAVLEGTQQHRRAHTGGMERDGEKISHRRVYLWSDRLQVSGFADLVEEEGSGSVSVSDLTPGDAERVIPWFDESDRDTGGRVLIPVEYKRGKQGRWMNDQIQLCAQAMCLEERTGRGVLRGAIFYWRSRRRVEVSFTPELREQTEDTVRRAFALLRVGKMPLPVHERIKCRECSLESICLPREVLLLTKDEN